MLMHDRRGCRARRRGLAERDHRATLRAHADQLNTGTLLVDTDGLAAANVAAGCAAEQRCQAVAAREALPMLPSSEPKPPSLDEKLAIVA